MTPELIVVVQYYRQLIDDIFIMKQFLLTYLGTAPQDMKPEQGQQHMKDYRQWLTDLGDAVVSPANPLKDTHTIHPDGSVTRGGNSTMSGYTIIQAENIEDALDIAKKCPYITIGGILEVSELLQMG